MHSDYVISKLNKAISEIDVDINDSLKEFYDCIKYAGHCMLKSTVADKNKRNAWFDSECCERRKCVRKALRKISM